MALLISGAASAYAVAGWKVFAVDKSIAAYFLWAALTVTWSVAPEISVRRLVLAVAVTATLWALVRSMGEARTLRATAFCIALMLASDLAAVALLDNSVHGVGERDHNLVGLWKGLHSHKNIASSVAFFGIIMAIICRNFSVRSRAVLLSLGILMIFGSSSKTTILIAPIVLLVVCLSYIVFMKRSLRLIGYICVFLATVTVSYLIASNLSEILEELTSPLAFTGRGALWAVMLDYLSANPLGAGFSAFWNVGFRTPALMYAPYDLAMAPHGHNGYLELLATTGYVGFFLAMAAVVVRPIFNLLFKNDVGTSSYVFYASVAIYMLLRNITESSFLNGDRVDWVMFVVASALFYSSLGQCRQAS